MTELLRDQSEVDTSGNFAPPPVVNIQLGERILVFVFVFAPPPVFSIQLGERTLDCPTALFYIWIFVCKYTNLKDSATSYGGELF